MAPPSASRTPAPPFGVIVIALVLVLEAVALVVLAVASLVTVFTAEPVSVGGSVFLTVLLLAVAAGLSTVAARLLQGFRWPRSPALVIQLFLVILSFPYFSAGDPILGFVLMVPAAAVIVLLFSRPVLGFTVRTTGAGKAL
ncbi:hypothetical protein PTW37_11080 [Arthrobacter agilis]|uniref:hypothetical protein n=1 Tax=Arthrobacter agilis TaxID=37921 RepID=UPI0023669F12|nr:hypothetical protein [Arthrobacter agilis]WDF32411.1 hypothetical protein PTW37_11080 [Arthrobacter agilis]